MARHEQLEGHVGADGAIGEYLKSHAYDDLALRKKLENEKASIDLKLKAGVKE